MILAAILKFTKFFSTDEHFCVLLVCGLEVEVSREFGVIHQFQNVFFISTES